MSARPAAQQYTACAFAAANGSFCARAPLNSILSVIGAVPAVSIFAILALVLCPEVLAAVVFLPAAGFSLRAFVRTAARSRRPSPSAARI